MRYFLLSLALIIAGHSFCQVVSDTSHKVMPEYPGGEKAMHKFMSENIRYPGYDLSNDIQGRVVLELIISAEGAISDIKIMHSVSPGLDAEAIRIARKFPVFKPGMLDGKPVQTAFVLPLSFKINSEPAPAPTKKKKKAIEDNSAVIHPY